MKCTENGADDHSSLSPRTDVAELVVVTFKMSKTIPCKPCESNIEVGRFEAAGSFTLVSIKI